MPAVVHGLKPDDLATIRNVLATARDVLDDAKTSYHFDDGRILSLSHEGADDDLRLSIDARIDGRIAIVARDASPIAGVFPRFPVSVRLEPWLGTAGLDTCLQPAMRTRLEDALAILDEATTPTHGVPSAAHDIWRDVTATLSAWCIHRHRSDVELVAPTTDRGAHLKADVDDPNVDLMRTWANRILRPLIRIRTWTSASEWTASIDAASWRDGASTRPDPLEIMRQAATHPELFQ
jgi:hypothetical protein